MSIHDNGLRCQLEQRTYPTAQPVWCQVVMAVLKRQKENDHNPMGVLIKFALLNLLQQIAHIGCVIRDVTGTQYLSISHVN